MICGGQIPKTHPLYILPGGRKQQARLRKQYRPIATAVLFVGAPPDAEGTDRARSPRIITSGWITVLPPSMMFCVPTRVALRATLLPVSYGRTQLGSASKIDLFNRPARVPAAGAFRELTVSMYSPLGGRRDILSLYPVSSFSNPE